MINLDSLAGHKRLASHFIYLVGAAQLGLDGNNILVLVNFDDPVDLCGIAHQLHGSGVHHSLGWVAVHRHVVEHDVRDGNTAISLQNIIILVRDHNRVDCDSDSDRLTNVKGWLRRMKRGDDSGRSSARSSILV